MAYGLPVNGEVDWDTKVSASIEAVKVTADAGTTAAAAALTEAESKMETVSVSDLPAGSVLAVHKTTTWPARPAATPPPGLTVLWIGPDPSPAIITSGVNGMYDKDIRMVYP